MISSHVSSSTEYIPMKKIMISRNKIDTVNTQSGGGDGLEEEKVASLPKDILSLALTPVYGLIYPS